MTRHTEAARLTPSIGQACRHAKLGRVQELLTTGDNPLGETYRAQIAGLRRWLRAREVSPEQRDNYAHSSVHKAVAAVLSWLAR
jgi:hypothetical protein